MSATAAPGRRDTDLQLFGDAPVEERTVESLLRPAGARPMVPDGGRLTLEQRLASVWEGLLAVGEADCPVCHGRLVRSGPAGLCEACGASVA